MARKLTSREYLLVGVLAVAGILALYVGRGGSFDLGGASEEEGPGSMALGAAPAVHMERLSLPAETYDPLARNLFDYYTPPPPRVKAPPRPRPTPTPRPVEVADRPPPPPPPPRVEQPPHIPFTYLGYLGPKDDKIAVFEQGQEMLLARVGEVLQEKFRLVDFKYESVVMGFTDEKYRDRTTELRRKP